MVLPCLDETMCSLKSAVSWYGHVLPEGAQTLEKLTLWCFVFGKVLGHENVSNGFVTATRPSDSASLLP